MSQILTKKSHSTRERILESAIKLFNEKGVSFVNTHHIARASGLSPGNLYYHFKNKEEILLDIFSKIELFSEESWKEKIADEKPEGFQKFVEFFFSELKKYRFFFREHSQILQADPKLALLWEKRHGSLSTVMEKAAKHWVKLGILKKFDSQEEINHFIDNSWIVAIFSSSYHESLGEKQPNKLQRKAITQFLSYLTPYHTDKGKKLLQQIELN